ncbi:D-alanyl-D-alanine carboxypeptidase family protein [Arthrobacter sp. zg-Y820]|uniref:D-alanyl-D-alanine carboxypeptidase family protein n=1 Tax=unclassified Arthrobacter TaxID=235627 RepID=UPI001E34C5B3|nr:MULTISPECIES: D-alanyl-D-alanine carboxypeptidase family protein [unclassified Arthrobacter]MCC9196016.1 D-alanyl-D-alanine carboxypeptidase family protein [Arthrobacter sp. zg-Y820]MDK1278875.1 D-alanyl-D-alanine carboxypeptidase family protein [Arthrobacter sp. zg.Y820]WIB08710.1 D-alanyl-D-alanine carboxypeptidase family protein [Arthrobacter sp. zg-Y820]
MNRRYCKPVPVLLAAAALLAVLGAAEPSRLDTVSPAPKDAAVPLALPSREASCGLRDGGCVRNHYYGATIWSPNTGTYPVRGAIHSAWAAEGSESGTLGYPVDAQVCLEGSCTQHFERGTISTARRGALVVDRAIDDATDTAVVVNKQRPLNPATHVPENLVDVDGHPLRSEAASAFGKLKDGAAADGVAMSIVSGYRSYEQQAGLYNSYVAQYGRETADTISARPGHSEHQTGLAVDIAAPDGTCSLQACFEETAAGAWAAENAHRFGFIVRYPADASATTGYAYEPWHLRFVGADVAQSMHRHATATLEEYLGLPAAENY